MGLAGNNLAELLQFQNEILKRPVAGLLVPPPYYIRPSLAGLEVFFKTVADASSVPIILYDIPYRTGVAFEQATLLNIVAHERVVAIKDCGGNQSNTLLRVCRHRRQTTRRNPPRRIRFPGTAW